MQEIPNLSELMGKDADDIVKSLSNENVDVHKIAAGSPVTADYRTNRIRVYYDIKTNKVTDVTIG